MSSVLFNEKKLVRVLKDLYLVTGIRISVFEPPIRCSLYDSSLNYENSVSYPREMPHCFCRTVRNCGKIDENCLICDENAVNIVIRTKKTYIYRCHLGFSEVLIPIVINENVEALCFFGQIKGFASGIDFLKMFNKISHIDFDFFGETEKNELEKEFLSMKTMTDDSAEALSRLIEDLIPGWVQSGIISTAKNNLKSEFTYYVQKNLNRHIKLSEVTEALNISQAHLCRIVKQEFGMSFTEYINNIKIKKACEYLANTDFSVSEISRRLGFEDSNYFSRLFKKLIGENAISYRNKQKNGKNIEI